MGIILILLIVLGVVVYKLSTKNYDYWRNRGVPYVKPIPLFGNFFQVFTFQTSIGHLLAKFYNQFKTPYFGVFVLNKPLLIVRDPNLIKKILVKDFNYFDDRTILSDEECDSLTSSMLFLLKNPEWKFIRAKVSPVFSSGKIKSMLPLITEAAEELKSYLRQNLEKQSMDAREVCAKFSTNIIASCAFGINANCFLDENASFRVTGRKLFDITIGNAFRQSCYFVAPSIVKLLKFPFLDPSVTKFMRDVFWEAIREREKSNFTRHDLIDIILQIKAKSAANESFNFEGDRVVAQAGQFYGAGFETVSATLSYTLYELALHPEIQTKLRSEIRMTKRSKGGFTYDALQDMKYLHLVISETLRKYPVLPFLDRRCNSDYKVPDSNLVIEKDTAVFIPLFGLHYDAEYFPDPEKYNPDRFSEVNKSTIPPYAVLPFGEGPRACVGERFGLIVVKLGLAHILSEYGISCSSDTPLPLVYETKAFLLTPRNGLPLHFEKLVSDAV